MSTNEIRARVEAFTADLTALIHKAALDAVNEVLGGTGASAPSRRNKPGRPSGSSAKAAKTSRAQGRRPGEKRDPTVLAAVVEKLYGYIKANPGKRIEPIGAALGIATKELALPVKKLMAAKRITSKGQKRATTYSAVASSNGLVLLPKKNKKKAVAEKTAAAASK